MDTRPIRAKPLARSAIDSSPPEDMQLLAGSACMLIIFVAGFSEKRCLDPWFCTIECADMLM